jgi:translation initiation factor IF-3
VEIQVIGTHGEPLSPMTRRKAEQLAQEKNLKLVVIDANSQPLPTWQLMTMQQYLSERQTLRQNKQAMKQPSTKIVKISASIAQHDLDTKVSHTVEWLKKGHPVKFVISNSKDEKGAESVFNSVVAATKDVSTVQQAKQTTTDMTFHMTPKCAASSGDCPPPSNMPPPSDPSRVDKVQKPFKLDELRKLQASTQAAEAENKKDAS